MLFSCECCSFLHNADLPLLLLGCVSVCGLAICGLSLCYKNMQIFEKSYFCVRARNPWLAGCPFLHNADLPLLLFGCVSVCGLAICGLSPFYKNIKIIEKCNFCVRARNPWLAALRKNIKSIDKYCLPMFILHISTNIAQHGDKSSFSVGSMCRLGEFTL